ncbi:hypothetical protein V6R21_13595 [Limibacter armeniacum]|uniref:hypothetical protein n=1 Tax=Limibacter armeniacum TaxID=466084 RepID=UPI002FE5BDC9
MRRGIVSANATRLLGAKTRQFVINLILQLRGKEKKTIHYFLDNKDKVQNNDDAFIHGINKLVGRFVILAFFLLLLVVTVIIDSLIAN